MASTTASTAPVVPAALVPALMPARSVSTEDQSSSLSKMFFFYGNSIFVAGNTPEGLREEDLLNFSSKDDPSRVSSEFEKILLEKQRLGAPNAVQAALMTQFYSQVFYAGLFKFVNSTLNLAPPILLNFLLSWLNTYAAGTARNPSFEGYVWCCALFVAMVSRTFVEQQYFHGMVRVGFQMRTALSTSVYRKALRLSPVARMDTPTGQIVNLMQLDTNRLDMFMMQLHVLWDGLYQILTQLVLLGIYIGPSCLAGFATMIILIPVNFWAMNRSAAIRRNIVKENDQRVKVMNEVLQGIRALKLYAWESFFGAKIGAIRDRELRAVKDAAIQTAITSTIMFTAPIVVAVVTLLVYAGSGGSFNSATIFTALSILNTLRFPLMFYPMAIAGLADAKVSLERLNKFMEQSEVPRANTALIAATPSITDAAPAPAAAPAAPGSVALTVRDASPPTAPPPPPPATHFSPSALAAASLPPAQVGIRVTQGTFSWEEPSARVKRLSRKAGEEVKAGAEKAKKSAEEAMKKEGKTPATVAALAAAVAALRGPTLKAAMEEGERKAVAPAPPALTGVNFTIPAGELWALVGPVGVGKSALVSSILSELAPSLGASVTLGSDRLSYTSQSPWVLNASLKQNIVFSGDAHSGGGGVASAHALARGEAGDAASTQHSAKDEAYYAQVVKACALEADLAALPAGDRTEIGERGINLSGGQKARVSLARAAYTRAPIALLDDPLSALDAEVGRSVFEGVIGNGGIMAGSTRLLVTNALHCLPQCDGVLMMAPGPGGTGVLVAAGKFSELVGGACPEFTQLVEAYGHMGDSGGKEKGEEAAATTTTATSTAAAGATPTPTLAALPSKKDPSSTLTVPGGGAAAAAAAAKKPGGIMTVEEKKDGAVKGMYYWRYLSSGGPPIITIPLLLLSFILMQFAQTINQWWLVFWTSDVTYLRFSINTYMGIYFATGVASALFSFVRIITTGFMGVRASRKLHGDLFKAVISAPMSFFDTTPVGRLISRFTKDMDAVDVTLPSSLGMFAMMVWGIIFSLGAIIFAVPWFAVAILPIGYMYQRWMMYFRNTARECKRYDNIKRSPIYAHFSESLGGLATIRAYGLTTIFSGTNEARVGDSVRAYYNLKVCDRWLAIRLEALGNVVVLATGLLCVGTTTLSSRTDGSASGLSGFALTFAMSLTGLMNFGVRMAADAEQQMTAVERVVEYVDDTPSEPYDAPPGVAPPPPAWPSQGTLAFEKYHMRYRPDTPRVLHGISFSIRAGERVGVVGRTGSGKSSVMAALFRLVTKDCKEGTVRLDGVDTDGVALSRLRPSLAIIPQDPTVFSGTLRANLDPSEVLGPASPASDAALWAALDKVNLKAWAERLDKQLDAPISEFGENLSVGQKQLVCLCRVLIRASKITVLALDEASASLDHVSDAALQKVIQENFLHATHFIVAHRLHSIIGCDRILVLDKGEVAEFDHPHVLLQKQGGTFAKLVDELGESSAASLKATAKETFGKRKEL